MEIKLNQNTCTLQTVHDLSLNKWEVGLLDFYFVLNVTYVRKENERLDVRGNNKRINRDKRKIRQKLTPGIIERKLGRLLH